jgi:hypothetical protein
MKIHFVLLCEGPFDTALIPHLRSLLVECGATEVTGVAPDLSRLQGRISRDINAKVCAALALEKNVNLLFIHRDADSTNPEPRYSEITSGVAQSGYSNAWIGIVPVQEIEAWLLLNESAIRRLSGCPNGRVRLNLPHSNRVEGLANPKEKLRDAILLASETSGRRYERLTRKIPSLCRQLLTELKLDGPLLDVPSWVRLKKDVSNYMIANSRN